MSKVACLALALLGLSLGMPQRLCDADELCGPRSVDASSECAGEKAPQAAAHCGDHSGSGQGSECNPVSCGDCCFTAPVLAGAPALPILSIATVSALSLSQSALVFPFAQSIPERPPRG